MYEFIDKTSATAGTKITREALMAMQGFIGVTVTYNDDGSIVETNSKGQTRTITFETDGNVTTITEVFKGDATIKKVTTITEDTYGVVSSVTEVVN